MPRKSKTLLDPEAIRKRKEILRSIEREKDYMCAHYPLCRGCPIDDAARLVKITCAEFQRKQPEETARIVKIWHEDHCPAGADV
jgi:hypothetical protein